MIFCHLLISVYLALYMRLVAYIYLSMYLQVVNIRNCS